MSAASTAAMCYSVVRLERATYFKFADGTVFYASKVRKDVMFVEFMECKYAWDDVKYSLYERHRYNGNI